MCSKSWLLRNLHSQTRCSFSHNFAMLRRNTSIFELHANSIRICSSNLSSLVWVLQVLTVKYKLTLKHYKAMQKETTNVTKWLPINLLSSFDTSDNSKWQLRFFLIIKFGLSDNHGKIVTTLSVRGFGQKIIFGFKFLQIIWNESLLSSFLPLMKSWAVVFVFALVCSDLKDRSIISISGIQQPAWK